MSETKWNLDARSQILKINEQSLNMKENQKLINERKNKKQDLLDKIIEIIQIF